MDADRRDNVQQQGEMDRAAVGFGCSTAFAWRFPGLSVHAEGSAVSLVI